MLSDDSSSDSETGRFKCRTKPDEEQLGNKQKYDKSKPSERRRQSYNDRLKREFDKKREERNDYSRDRPRYSRHSPVSRRRYSRDRSPYKRRSPERHHKRDSRAKSNTKDYRSRSRDRQKHSNSRSHKPPELKRDLKEEIKRNLQTDKTSDKGLKKSRERSCSPLYKGKQSVVQKPPPTQSHKRKSDSPIIVDENDSDHSEQEVQPGSYYNMIPTVVKDKSEESSEIDSSDDEKLRAKLLNIEKELQKTKKKKHKKKHKKKSSKCSKEKDHDVTTTVEVSSTTDIDDKLKIDVAIDKSDTLVEVSSTQKSTQKESSEEGEISSEDDSQNDIDNDPTDLRHKLRRSTKIQKNHETKINVCGPVLPPHLQKQHKRSSLDFEGPVLPPYLKQKPKNIGMYYVCKALLH